MAARIALFDMTAKRRGPAAFDRGHHPALRGRQRTAVLLTMGITIAAEDVRHFRHRAVTLGDQPCSGGIGRSSGLRVAQTLLAAIRR